MAFLFNISKIHKHPINITKYTAHPHGMVHIPAQFRENTVMSLRVAVRKLNVTDGRGHFNISRPGPSAWREKTTVVGDKYTMQFGVQYKKNP